MKNFILISFLILVFSSIGFNQTTYPMPGVTKTVSNSGKKNIFSREAEGLVFDCEVDISEFVKFGNLGMLDRNGGCDNVVANVKCYTIEELSQVPHILDYFENIAEAWVSYQYAVQNIDTDLENSRSVEYKGKSGKIIDKKSIRLKTN